VRDQSERRDAESVRTHRITARARLNDLAGHCQLETIGRNSDPFLVRSIAGQAVYLLRGELALTYPDGTSKVLVGGSERSKYPLAQRGEVFHPARRRSRM